MSEPTLTQSIPNVTSNKLRRTVGLVMMILGVGFMGFGLIFGLTQFNSMGEQMKAYGLTPHRFMLVLALEGLGVLLYAIPRTRAFGLLMIAGYLGGAMATHLEHAERPILPAVFLAFIIFGTWLRHPQVLWQP